MKQLEQAQELGDAERRRREAIVQTLATLESGGESLADLAHDARNMVTALGLYCDLIEEPGVLSAPYLHYGSELRLVATASRRLVEKLAMLKYGDASPAAAELRPIGAGTGTGLGGDMASPEFIADRRRASGSSAQRWDAMPAQPIENLAAELEANRNLLAALAGPSIALTVSVEGGGRPVRLTGEDLTRVLVNLVKNSAEAMPGGGRIAIGLRELPVAEGPGRLSLTIEDNGSGIPEGAIEHVFESGFTTRARSVPLSPGWPSSHRGLGLSISRSIVETAGGRIAVSNRAPAGTRLEIELPVRER